MGAQWLYRSERQLRWCGWSSISFRSVETWFFYPSNGTGATEKSYMLETKHQKLTSCHSHSCLWKMRPALLEAFATQVLKKVPTSSSRKRWLTEQWPTSRKPRRATSSLQSIFGEFQGVSRQCKHFRLIIVSLYRNITAIWSCLRRRVLLLSPRGRKHAGHA